MPRPALAVLATLSLTGLFAAAAAVAQGIPGVPFVIDAPLPPSSARAAAAQPKGKLLDRVIAIVNEGIVMESELEEAIANYVAEQRRIGSRPPPPERLRAPILDALITRELQLQRAERAKITVSEEDLQRALKRVAENAQPRPLKLEELPEALKADGMDYEDFRDTMRKEMLIGQLERREVYQHINITPRELEQHMERLKKLPNENDLFDVSDILISVSAEPSKAEMEEARKKAQEVYARTATEDFGNLAIQFSKARTALEGGKLGVRKGADLPTELAETIVQLKPGEVSRPFETSSGYHIVKLNAVERAEEAIQEQVLVRHILVKPTPLEDAATVRLKLAGVRQKVLDGQDFAAFASTMSVDGSKADGGQLEWTSPEEFVGEFGEVVQKLKENEISEPFETEYGWHIVQLLGRRKADITEDMLRERAFIQLRNNKANEEVELWRRQMRDEAFVQILDSGQI